MDRPVELVPLVCLKCSTPIPANPDEVAWVCSQCGRGMLLFEKHGLVELGVNYSGEITPNTTGRPFWVADGQVSVQTRQTYSGNQAEEAETLWSQPRRFFIPAFTCSLEDFLSLGMNALLQPPALEPGPPARFLPVTLSTEDILAAAEFIVMAIEAGRKDKLREINFSVVLSSPDLWVLP